MAPRPGISQEMILEKAFKIADEEGVHAVTMATLARELSIKPPSLYNHFDGITAVKKAMAIRGIERLHKSLKKAVQNTRDEADAIRAIGEAYLRFAYRHPGVYESTLSAPNPAARDVQAAGEPVVQLTTEALAGFPLNETEKIHSVRGFRSLLHGLVDLDQKGGFNQPVNLKESQQMMIEIFINGLRR